jgi:hypothetical protein
MIILLLIIIGFLGLGTMIAHKQLEKRICGLCAEHNYWAKRKNRGCDLYGCLYDK